MPTRQAEQLIEDLAQDAAPVRRLRPPMLRAAIWLAVATMLGAAAIALFADRAVFAARASRPELVVELAGTLLTGCLGVIAAFHLSLPDRSGRWALLPLPGLAIWLSGSGFGCYRHFLVHSGDDWALGDSWHCLLFILAIGIPLSAALLWSLRRARPVAPLPVALTGALGTAALAAFLLQFFHPFEVTFMDLGVHAASVAVVVALAGLSRDAALGTPAA